MQFCACAILKTRLCSTFDVPPFHFRNVSTMTAVEEPTESSSGFYRCIRCLEPADTLYRKHSESTIKLSQCKACGANADSYCELEFLLVVIDIVLLREEAYKHVLFNRLPQFNVETSYLKSLQYIVLSSFLQAYLFFEAHRYQHPGDTVLESTTWMLMMVVASCLRFLALGTGVYLSTILLTKQVGTSSDDYRTHLYLALLLPTTLQVVTILIHVWEKTDTIRQLGSLLMFSYQYMAVITALSLRANYKIGWIRYLIPLFGLCLQASVGLVWASTITTPLPCNAWEWTIPAGIATHNRVCIL